MGGDRIIFHIDVNSAFLSWESLEILKRDPKALDPRTILSVVGGDASQRRGIVLAKSTPARQYGIRTAEPLAQALRKCPSLTVIPSHYDIYVENSEKLMGLLEEYTPDIEKFSIDEAFLDMTSTVHLFGDPKEAADRLRQRINRELGFTVNIGVAPNKLLAKMASDFEKPDRTHTLFLPDIPEKMWPLPIRDLFYVGEAAQRKLENIGIHNIGQLARSDLAVLKTRLGDKYASLIHQYANGIDDDPVKMRDPINKGYGNSITLSRDISDLETAFQVLLSLSETVGARLRADKVLASCVLVELKDWEFHTQSHQTMLLSPTNSTAVIWENARRLLKEFWDLTPVRLIGVRAGKISDDGYSQMNLFESVHDKKMRKMEEAVDSIRERYGADVIRRASFLGDGSIVDHAASKRKHLKSIGHNPL